jgi:acyl carrier protein
LNKQEFLHRLDEVFELEPGTLTGDELLADIERWDSVTVLEFLALVDENFEGVEISPKQIPDCRTVNDLIHLVGSRVSA